MLDVGTHAVQATDPVGGPDAAYSSFDSVLCADDRTANDLAARRQAEMIASPDATMQFVPTSRLTRHGYRVLHDSCEGHDLLALGAGPAARTAVQHAPIPILVARTCPTGTRVTDSILVPVDASAESRCAVELAGRLAAADGATVTILAAPPRDAALQRAIAASGRILLNTTGAVPRVVGEQLPRERSVASTAVTLSASLVVLGIGRTKIEQWTTAAIIDSVGCSVLAVPCLRTDANDQDVVGPVSQRPHPTPARAC